jgi:hypothetical protein
MVLNMLLVVAGLLATGIETAYVPTDGGGGEYLVRVEPDLVRNPTPYTLTSDVPADARDVRRVKIYVADAWPPAVEQSVIEAAKRPRTAAVAAIAPRAADIETAALGKTSRPWGWLIGSLVALFLSLGANAYLGMLLGNMRARYLRDIQQGIVRV